MNAVSWLRKGKGKTPADGGCILQVIDWIDRESWTDKPVCVHPVLARLAIYVNDKLDDKGRQRLLDLTPRLMGTANDDHVTTIRLSAFAARRVLFVFEQLYPNDDRPRKALEATKAWCDEPCERTSPAAYYSPNAATTAANAAAAAMDLLIAVLDEYDRLANRTNIKPIDFTPIVEMLANA
jgi:hypothetical protein